MTTEQKIDALFLSALSRKPTSKEMNRFLAYVEKGGPSGKQICVEVCPVKALRLTREIPVRARGPPVRRCSRVDWSKLAQASYPPPSG
jgi:ferredoxin